MRLSPVVTLFAPLIAGLAACAPGTPPNPPAPPQQDTLAAPAPTEAPTITAVPSASAATASATAEPEPAPANASPAKEGEQCLDQSGLSKVRERPCDKGLVCCVPPSGINRPRMGFCRVPCTSTAKSGSQSGCSNGCPWALVP